MRLLNRDRGVVSMGGDCGDLEGGCWIETWSQWMGIGGTWREAVE